MYLVIVFQAITVTLALIFASKYIFENDYVRPSALTSTILSGTLADCKVKNISVDTGAGEVCCDTDGGIVVAKKALFHIGEGLQEKVTALVKSATNDDVCDFFVFAV